MVTEHVDIVIVGAGISGIAAAHHIRQQFPERRVVILERRESLGGTWHLFTYPGIRSDSDMYTLGYPFRPWTGGQAIAGGADILQYLRDTARESGIEPWIRYGHAVTRVSWSSSEARWTVQATAGDQDHTLSCAFLIMCTGYYRYDEGYTPDFEGEADFVGEVVHPQKWGDTEHAGKRVVVIGSGATAITLIPNLAKDAEHVTMLQRSPTYVVDLPGRDEIADRLQRVLPARVAHKAVRWKRIGMATFTYWLARTRPQMVRARIIDEVRNALGPDYDVEKHFTPRYDPWDQRVCVAPDGDLFAAIRSGKASVVTDTIERFTERGIRLDSGEELEADLIVTATGLQLQFLGGIELVVDDQILEAHDLLAYKGMMFGDVPNLAMLLGYTNASWTLKANLTAEYVCRLLTHMDRHNYDICVPTNKDPSLERVPVLDFQAGYVKRSLHRFPQQGSKAPWRVYQNYLLDLMAAHFASIEDEAMEFRRA